MLAAMYKQKKVLGNIEIVKRNHTCSKFNLWILFSIRSLGSHLADRS